MKTSISVLEENRTRCSNAIWHSYERARISIYISTYKHVLPTSDLNNRKLCVRTVIKFAALKTNLIPWIYLFIYLYEIYDIQKTSKNNKKAEYISDSLSLTLWPIYPSGALCVGRNIDSVVGFNVIGQGIETQWLIHRVLLRFFLFLVNIPSPWKEVVGTSLRLAGMILVLHSAHFYYLLVVSSHQ